MHTLEHRAGAVEKPRLRLTGLKPELDSPPLLQGPEAWALLGLQVRKAALCAAFWPRQSQYALTFWL